MADPTRRSPSFHLPWLAPTTKHAATSDMKLFKSDGLVRRYHQTRDRGFTNIEWAPTSGTIRLWKLFFFPTPKQHFESSERLE